MYIFANAQNITTASPFPLAVPVQAKGPGALDPETPFKLPALKFLGVETLTRNSLTSNVPVGSVDALLASWAFAREPPLGDLGNTLW
jgi:hypothetical protein